MLTTLRPAGGLFNNAAQKKFSDGNALEIFDLVIGKFDWIPA